MVFDQINLTTRERIDNRIRFLLFGGLTALVVIISLTNITKGYQIYHERSTYQDKLRQLKQQALKLQSTGAGKGNVSPKAYQALMNKGIRVNRLIALDIFPWARVLDALEKALPEVVIIDAFRPVDGFARIHLAGRTDSLDQLVRFQERLEASDIFTTVVLENMGLGGGVSGGTLPKTKSRMAFKLYCRLRMDRVFPEATQGALWRALKKAPQAK